MHLVPGCPAHVLFYHMFEQINNQSINWKRSPSTPLMFITEQSSKKFYFFAGVHICCNKTK